MHIYVYIYLTSAVAVDRCPVLQLSSTSRYSRQSSLRIYTEPREPSGLKRRTTMNESFKYSTLNCRMPDNNYRESVTTCSSNSDRSPCFSCAGNAASHTPYPYPVSFKPGNSLFKCPCASHLFASSTFTWLSLILMIKGSSHQHPQLVLTYQHTYLYAIYNTPVAS